MKTPELLSVCLLFFGSQTNREQTECSRDATLCWIDNVESASEINQSSTKPWLVKLKRSWFWKKKINKSKNWVRVKKRHFFLDTRRIISSLKTPKKVRGDLKFHCKMEKAPHKCTWASLQKKKKICTSPFHLYRRVVHKILLETKQPRIKETLGFSKYLLIFVAITKVLILWIKFN